MGWIIVIIIGGIWWFFSNSNGSSSTTNKLKFYQDRTDKYVGRVTNKELSLFDRNLDIIESFVANVNTSEGSYSYRTNRYENSYIDNITRDCINDICVAENNVNVYPDTVSLITWKMKAPAEWKVLAELIHKKLSERRAELVEKEKAIAQEKERKEKELLLEERKVSSATELLNLRKRRRKSPLSEQEIYKTKTDRPICIDEIGKILTQDDISWVQKEKTLISPEELTFERYPLFHSPLNLSSARMLNESIERFNKLLESDEAAVVSTKDFFTKIYTGYKSNIKDGVVERLNFLINSITLPRTIPKSWNVDFNPEEGIAIVEVMLPDVVHKQPYKEVMLKSGKVQKPLNQKEKLEHVPNIHPAIILRYAYEIFRSDKENIIKLLVVNGWVEYDDPKTGNKATTYTASLVVTKEQVINLNLAKVEPLSAFTNLKGKSAGKLIDIIPVSPMLSMNTKDKRFIETKDVLNKLSSETNLASMDWQDFENLIAELFRKEFSEEGTDIKLTQSSRDKGVDAVVFNPDPIRGGKYVIQAKRYTNTVDVSAVRDLVAVVAHEGASRGILVTTSTFGADAYAFVQNKPITLLDGAKLLGLLEKHSYKFKIDLAEARKLHPNSGKY